MQRKEPTLGSGDTSVKDTPLQGAPTIEAEPSPAGGPSYLTVISLVLALAGLGCAGFLYQQWQLAENKMAAAEQRIVQLEQLFEMSGEESAASVDVLGAKLKENSSEIRKLWGVAYDTNRKRIAANQATVASQQKTLTTLGNKVNGFGSNLKQISALEKSLAALRLSSSKGSREMNDTMAKLERQLASVRSDLTIRVGSNEEAIQSMDSYRRSVNKDLVQLREAIRSLQAGANTALSQGSAVTTGP